MRKQYDVDTSSITSMQSALHPFQSQAHANAKAAVESDPASKASRRLARVKLALQALGEVSPYVAFSFDPKPAGAPDRRKLHKRNVALYAHCEIISEGIDQVANEKIALGIGKLMRAITTAETRDGFGATFRADVAGFHDTLEPAIDRVIESLQVEIERDKEAAERSRQAQDEAAHRRAQAANEARSKKEAEEQARRELNERLRRENAAAKEARRLQIMAENDARKNDRGTNAPDHQHHVSDAAANPAGKGQQPATPPSTKPAPSPHATSPSYAASRPQPAPTYTERVALRGEVPGGGAYYPERGI